MKITTLELEKMKQKSHKSVLWDFGDEISVMRDEKISFQVINEWLKEQGIDTSVQNISQFHKRNKNAPTKSKKQSNSSLKSDGIFSGM